MRKITFIGSAMLMALFAPSILADESIPSVNGPLYDLTPWDNEQVLKLFSDAYNDGRNCPTKAEWESIGMGMDLEFVRSHTRQRAIDKDASKDVVSDINHDRKLWCNLPGGYGKGTAAYPRGIFDQDVFSMWNYTTIFGAWNYGFLQAPGSWVDAAHKNGTRIYGGIKFFESWNNDGSESVFQNFIQTKNPEGSEYTYKYSRAFVNAAAFFGSDGYNYNSEGTIFTEADYYNFHAEVRKIARDLNIEGFGIGQYTQQASLNETAAPYLIGTQDAPTYDCMLNYSGNKLAYRNVASSLSTAQKLGLTDYVYQGQLLVGLSGDYWTQMNEEARKPMNIAIWGDHDQSRFFQFRIGDDPITTQENYQMLLEKAFSGAYRNPLKRPAISNNWGSFQVSDPSLVSTQLANSPGFASMFPERTAIVGKLPFETHFCLGNGENYFYKGKLTHGAWYNMSQQDVVPTYRWLVTAKGNMTTYANDIDVRFTHEDAYMTGSSLKLSGATTAGNDIVIYRSKLTVSESNPKVTIALKGAQTGDSHLSVILKKTGSNDWIEIPCGELADKTWHEVTMPMTGVAQGDVIEYIGLRVNGTTSADWKLYVGKLKLSDDRLVQQALIKDGSVNVEVREETTENLSVKIGWEPDYAGYSTSIDEFGMVYNDEINVDHFEIFYKEGVDGKVKEVGRTAQWATIIPKLAVKQNTDAYIGVRSVSVDLKCCSPVQWVRVPHYEGTLPEPPEENLYGETFMSSTGNANEQAAAGYTPAEWVQLKIYAEKVTTTGATQDLNYQVDANPQTNLTQYYYAKDHKLVINQGQTVKLFFKGYESGNGCSLHYDFINVYMDYDGNYSFMDADETLGKFGNQSAGTIAIVNPGLQLTFTVPEDARPGESRLRIVGSDAWTPHPGATGGTVKGYSIDFPVEITGTNPGRGQAETYKDRRDEGDPEEPEFIDNGFADIEDVVGDATFASVAVEGKVAYFTNVEKAWFYDVNGRVVKFVNDGSDSVSVSDLTPGVYIVKMLHKQVVRSAKVVVK